MLLVVQGYYSCAILCDLLTMSQPRDSKNEEGSVTYKELRDMISVLKPKKRVLGPEKFRKNSRLQIKYLEQLLLLAQSSNLRQSGIKNPNAPQI